MKSDNSLLRFYRNLSTQILKPLLESRIFEQASNRGEILEQIPRQKKAPRAWFHAASVGELEMLLPVIEKWNSEIVLTVFSESATQALIQFKKAGSSQLLFAGYSPWEGEWRKALEIFQPDAFVSARYESWPELWSSLGEFGVPLFIVGAQARSSLRFAKWIVQAMKGVLPQFYFLAIEDGEKTALQEDFPQSKVEVTGDPRWERVFQRAKKGNLRAKELVARFSLLERPWGVLGSVWMSDLEVLKPALSKLPGTVWIVPHEVDSESVRSFEKFLDEMQLKYLKTSEVSSSKEMPRFILVDELGFLSELYASVDWAYVGGGFARSVHNTIEPAIHGIPVACGPKGIRRFPEVAFLRSNGQLQVLENEKDALKWCEQLRLNHLSGDLTSLKATWKSQAEERLGASERILTCINGVLASSKMTDLNS
jgi:3-deoxy-D-manno-octulosonic-acid transferase